MLESAALLALVGGMAAFGCGGFVHDEHLIGRYYLNAVDIPEQMSVSYALGNGNELGLIDETVFAVGWNDRYIVAKQHPANDRRVTNYYYLEMALDSTLLKPSNDPNWQHKSVTGPLTEAVFLAKKAELRLPDFTRVIRSLE